jgi:hypothetical protein
MAVGFASFFAALANVFTLGSKGFLAAVEPNREVRDTIQVVGFVAINCISKKRLYVALHVHFCDGPFQRGS